MNSCPETVEKLHRGSCHRSWRVVRHRVNEWVNQKSFHWSFHPPLCGWCYSFLFRSAFLPHRWVSWHCGVCGFPNFAFVYSQKGPFWVTVCKTALCYRTVVCPVCLWCWCIVAKQLDGSRRNLAQRYNVRWGPSFPQKGHRPLPVFAPCPL